MTTEMLTLRSEMKNVLDDQRYEHTLGVAYTATALAMCHGVDLDKAFIAGLLHDCAKGLSHEERLRICMQNNLPVSAIERENPSLLHAKVGAYLARTDYHVTDEDVLNAIMYHTTGRPAMGILEKIIYIADFIEPNRRPLRRMEEIRYLAFQDLDAAMLLTVQNVLEYLDATGKRIDDVTRETYEYYKKLAEENK